LVDEFGGKSMGKAIALPYSIFIQFNIPNAASLLTLHVFRRMLKQPVQQGRSE